MENIEGEIWKEIEGSDGYYLVSNMGRIWTKHRVVVRSDGRTTTVKERVYRGSLPACDVRYYQATITYNSKKLFSGHVHALVAMYFLGHTPDGGRTHVDHINFDKLDNRAENLQIISGIENTSRRRKNNTSKFIGVDWDSKRGKWCARKTFNGKRIWIGHFDDEEEAYFAYLRKLNELLYLNKKQ